MGSGKTTRAMIFLAELLNETIYITMPSRVLASKTHESLLAAVRETNSRMVVGMKI